MSNYGPRFPLHLQSKEFSKAAKNEASPSYETFKPNITHPSGQYGSHMQENRATVQDQYRMRRYPNGQLAYDWAAQQIVDAIRAIGFNGTTGDPNTGSASLTPIQVALLTVVFPAKYRETEPMQAEILTQLSDSEKEALAMLVAQQLESEGNWNAGFGGGSNPGTKQRDVGG